MRDGSENAHPDVVRLELAIAQNSGFITELRAEVTRLADTRAEAMTGAFVAAFRDPETERVLLAVARKFRDDPETLRIVYAGLATHASDGFAKWLGNRVIAVVTSMVLTGAFVWWLITGGPHK
jgi:hypothetical protein